MKKSEFSTEILEKALDSLEKALNPIPQNDRERDGAIQRFEYSFELCWKLAQKMFSSEGIQVHSPKAVIRELASQGLIDNPEDWLDFLEKRNLTSHTYNEKVAEKVFFVIGNFLKSAQHLLHNVKVRK